MQWASLLDRPLLIVSGKGGTGKSTVSAALALAAAARGRKVLLAEVEGRSEVTRTLGVPDPGFHDRAMPFGFSVISITAREAALEYLHRYLGMSRVSRPLARSGALDHVVGGAPGFRDLLILGKLYEMGRTQAAGPAPEPGPAFDLTVVDGPPTGQLGAFLSAPATFAELIRVGRMQRQAEAIDRMLHRRAAIVLVTLLEEMSVTETIEAVSAVASTGIGLGAMVANRARPPVFAAGVRPAFTALTPSDLARVCLEHGVSMDAERATRLRAETAGADAVRRRERRQLGTLREHGPVLVLSEVAGGEGPDLVARLAREMAPAGSAVAGRLAIAPVPRPASSAPPTLPTPTAVAAASTPSAESLDQLLAGSRVVVVCGSGGVGKTTVSAAVAVHLADRGRTTALLTVDPARRLATALRLPMTPGEWARVPVGRGRSLEAMQLDTQRTFDDLVRRHAPSPERRDRILGNSFYRRIADTLAGTNEYMAMEKLYTLAEEEDHQAIVIDTPPTRSAVSFLEAPRRLSDFLGGRFFRWMVWPTARAGRLSLSAARLGATAFLRTVGRLVGAEVLSETVEFLASFEGMYGGFQDRAERVLDLLRSPGCAFVVVAGATPGTLHQAGSLVQRLSEAGMGARAIVVNRWHGADPSLPGMARQAAEHMARGTPEQRAAAAILSERLREEPRVSWEGEAVSSFQASNPGVSLLAVPELTTDVQDIAGLRRVGEWLFRETGEGVGRANLTP